MSGVVENRDYFRWLNLLASLTESIDSILGGVFYSGRRGWNLLPGWALYV